MALIDFENVIRHLDFSAGGADLVNGRWTDYGPHAQHAPFTAGVPSFAAVGGHTVWNPALDGSCYTEGLAPRGSYSVIMPFYWDSTGIAYPYWLANGTYAPDDHDAQVNTMNGGNWSTIDTAYLYFSNTIAQFSNVAGSPAAQKTGITKGQWNVAVAVLDLLNSKVKLQINDTAPIVGSAASWNNMIGFASELVRVGHITLTSITGTIGLGSLTEISGDVMAEQGDLLAAEIERLKTFYAIP